MSNDQIRKYDRATSVVFLKTNDKFGGLSNMAGGFPLLVNEIRILTSEALYQACRFPHMPNVQKMIIGERSPMTAKMKSKPYRQESRPDWDRVRVKIMRWCLRVKLAQNWRAFSELLLETGERPIVEESRKDDFWGANPNEDGSLVGMNVLGRLLMELREAVKTQDKPSLLRVEPLDIADFLLNENLIAAVGGLDLESSGMTAYATSDGSSGTEQPQQSLFDSPAVRDGRSPKYSIQNETDVNIADLRAYKEYKKSDQVWLGRVPAHWQVLPNRSLFSEVKDRNRPDEQMLSVTITRGIVPQKILLTGSSKKDSSRQDKSAYKLVQPNDIAYNKMRAWQGAIGVSDLRGIISPAYIVQRLRSAPNVPRYFHHLYRTPGFAKEAERWSYGITSDMWSLRPEHFKLIYTAVPPPEEQAAIVKFLDWGNGRLERAIRAKRKVIALLNEQKQAIIHRVVTRGLDPSVPLKPSGIPWLGGIPEHWEVRRAKYLYREVDERSIHGDEEMLSVSHLTGVTPRSQKNVTMFKAESYEGHKLCHPNDLVVNTMWAWMGALGTSKYLGIISPAYAVYRPLKVDGVFGTYMDWLLRSRPYISNIICRSTGLRPSRLRLYPEEFFRLPIIQPPIEEQKRIVDAVQAETANLATTISRLDREIELFLEYRTRLAADVVTGKLDVREASARLPDELAPEIAKDDADLTDEIESSDEEAAA